LKNNDELGLILGEDTRPRVWSATPSSLTSPANSTAFEIFIGDCVPGMRSLDSQSVDVVVTSPPYNLGKEYSTYQDNKTPEEYLEWCEEWAIGIRRVLKPDGSFFLNLGGASANPFFAFEVAAVMKRVFELQNTIHWIKSISIDTDNGTESCGHFKPINSTRFLNDCHEYVFHFTPGGNTPLDRLAIGVPYADKTNIKRWAHTGGRDKRCRGNTWFIPYKTIRQRATERPHPATFPTELAVKCIRLHGRKNAVVLDPFLGIGHSAYAAKECADLVSTFIGFDVDEEYIRIACGILGCQPKRQIEMPD
jgi:site-specific DNA-methyltransferase (adenine-specific)